MLKKFNEIFGVKTTKEQSKTEFLNRLNALLDYLSYHSEYINILKNVCFELGLNYKDHVEEGFIRGAYAASLPTIAKGDSGIENWGKSIMLCRLKTYLSLNSFGNKNFCQ